MWDQVGTRARHRIATDQVEGERAVFSLVPGALARAILIAMLVATPSLVVPSTGADTAQIVIVLSILAGFMTFIEYYGKYPSIIEFRFAPPFNRAKFFALTIILVSLAMIVRGTTHPTEATEWLTHLGRGLGEAIDFPYSPVRLVVLMMPADADAALIDMVRIASGISYTVSLVMILSLIHI